MFPAEDRAPSSPRVSRGEKKIGISQLLEYSMELAEQDKVEQLKDGVSSCLRLVQWPGRSATGECRDIK